MTPRERMEMSLLEAAVWEVAFAVKTSLVGADNTVEILRAQLRAETHGSAPCVCPQIQAADHKRHFKGCALRDVYPDAGVKTAAEERAARIVKAAEAWAADRAPRSPSDAFPGDEHLTALDMAVRS